MTTTIRARFNGKVFVPHGHVDLPVDEEVTIHRDLPPSPSLSPPAQQGARPKRDWQAFFEEMDKHSIHAGNSIDYSRESCYDDTIHDPD